MHLVGLRRACPDKIKQGARYFNDETGIRRGGIALRYLTDKEGLPNKEVKYQRAISTRRIPNEEFDAELCSLGHLARDRV